MKTSTDTAKIKLNAESAHILNGVEHLAKIRKAALASRDYKVKSELLEKYIVENDRLQQEYIKLIKKTFEQYSNAMSMINNGIKDLTDACETVSSFTRETYNTLNIEKDGLDYSIFNMTHEVISDPDKMLQSLKIADREYFR